MGAIVERSVERLLDQQRDGQNWIDFLTVQGEVFEEILQALVDLSTSTWLDTAEGVWLDRVGEIIGVLRPPDEEVDNVFTVTEYTEPLPDSDMLHGFGELGQPTYGGYVWDLLGLVLTTTGASDEVYRSYIAAKQAATNADASIPGIARFFLIAFDLVVTVTRPYVGRLDVTLPATGYDLRQRRYMKILCPVVAGIDLHLIGWPEV